MPIVPVILAGGQGTRLWPLSRTARPKQFLSLTGKLTPFQETLLRIDDVERYAPPIIVTNAEYRFVVAEQAQEIGLDLGAILLEPVSRSTMPAIAASAIYIQRHGLGDVIHVLPSDASISANENYWRAVDTARAAAEGGRLITFGVAPTRPETGYGYIEAGPLLADGTSDVVRFVEKPNRDKAEVMLRQGGFYWNSGMFVLGVRSFLDECHLHSPVSLAAATGAVDAAKTDLDFVRLDEESFARAPNISVDYAVFEKSQRVAMVAADFFWSDLGSWDAVWKVLDKDADQNAVLGRATIQRSSNSLVYTDKTHVALSGLDNVAVIATEDAVFVGKLDEAQSVGEVVRTLRANPDAKPLIESHRTTYRPWGGYSSVLSGARFQVKRLFVRPGKQLSLQKHHHRAEHWVVVSGTAEVTVDNKVTVLSENESIYLPLGCVHRLANPGKILLELIEVQTGSYLGEDDIIRIADDFGRS